MESDSNLTKPGTLFPAYSSANQVQEKKEDRDWLCNSSFTPATYEFSCQQQLKTEECNIDISETTETEKHILPKQTKERKKQHVSDPIKHQVPDCDSIRKQLNKKTFIEETGLSFERAYRLDPKCDYENLNFDCFERKNIAKYKMKFGVPFGLSLEEFAQWPQPMQVKKDVLFRYFGKKALKLFNKSGPPEVIRGKELPSFISGALDFIPISTVSREEVSLLNDTKVVFDGISVDWKVQSSDKYTNAVLKNEQAIESSVESDIRNKTIYFNKKLLKSPNDVQLWLDFVEFQDEVCHADRKSESAYNESAIFEKKISIFDKALKYNPKSVELHIAKLNLCRKVWKIDKLISLWDDLIFMNPNNPEVWQSYLFFVLTNLAYFNTPRIVKLYSKCLRTLSNLNEGIIQSHEAPPNLTLFMLDIFSQLCFALRSCGYSERAIATFQALIEFNFFCDPSTRLLSVSEKITCFEPFWDSGAARIGEDEAIGWAATVSKAKIVSNKIVSESDLNSFEDDILYEKLPLGQTWLKFERLREVHHWLPWRPNPDFDQTDDDVDDMERTVSFDDVSRFLFNITDEKDKFLLLVKFLEFLGFSTHMLFCSESSVSKNCFQVEVKNFETISEILSESVFSNQTSNPLSFPRSEWTQDKINFINNIFSLIMDKFSSHYQTLLSRMWLKFRKIIITNENSENYDRDISDLKKFAKSMLKKNENRNSLLLWSEYIEIELLSKLKSNAKNTFETLLVSSSAAISEESSMFKEVWYFIRSYIDLNIGLRNHIFKKKEFCQDELLWILTHVGSKETFVPYLNQTVKPTSVLRAVSGFKQFLDQELSSLRNLDPALCYCLDPRPYLVLDCIKCFAFLQYFTQGIDAALQIFKNYSVFLEKKISVSLKRYFFHLAHFRTVLCFAN
ncbi:nuclear exosome regulator NRDE2-like isoform X2 [Stegodyphus dumicola]|uniref:nuclear exosome regulator NRDE2-like isoform X2 n=1 Tax=Stegodyphus dumicola TaxID=202533 RepID=UPI0015AEDE67|nr:nuclear exosome regulator NRDE2-like isoform X2 [Stegodyphus dumicola]